MKKILSRREKIVLSEIQDRAKIELKNENSGHDYWHACRVMKMNQHIARNYRVDLMALSFAGLLHDIAYPEIKDSKNYARNHLMSSEKANAILKKDGRLSKKLIQKIKSIIEETEYLSKNSERVKSIEARIQQDSDKLDAIGAIGIGRVFLFASKYKIPIHDPQVLPRLSFNADEISKTVVNHFYEKLLKLDSGYNTEEATGIAKNRVAYMREFLDKLLQEC